MIELGQLNAGAGPGLASPNTEGRRRLLEMGQALGWPRPLVLRQAVAFSHLARLALDLRDCSAISVRFNSGTGALLFRLSCAADQALPSQVPACDRLTRHAGDEADGEGESTGRQTLQIEVFSPAAQLTGPAPQAVEAARRCLAERTVQDLLLDLNTKNAALEESRLNLEQRITERTLELRQAMAIAEAAVETKSAFLANMSHEIRTPMNAIIGLAHLCLRTELNPRQHDYVSKIHQSGQSLLGILNDILDFSRIEAGQLSMEHIGFELDRVLEGLVTVIAQRAYSKGLELLIDVHSDVPRQLLGDPLRLGQVLINLVGNAIKFTEQGQVSVVIRRLTPQDESNSMTLEFAVEDTGIGMTAQQCQKMFKAFSQADESTTRKYGGTGLGLAISKRLVELMEGTIAVHSSPGVGSRFHFTARLGVGLSAGPDQPRAVPTELSQARALLVDDNPVAARILCELLERLGLRVDCSPSALAAYELLATADSQDPYTLVFLDWKMPVVDGMQAAQHIRQEMQLAGGPRLVMVTAFGMEEVRTRAEGLGVDGFLHKPVGPSILLDCLLDLYGAGNLASRAHRGEEPDFRFHDTHVLLVEDNEINRQIALELLALVGVSAEVAVNGAEALTLLEQRGPQAFAMVFMDMQMPVMDGHEAALRLRADPLFDSLPIIAMTAHAMADERERCLQEGMQAHIAKPLDPKHLYTTLAEFSQGRATPNTGQAALPPMAPPLSAEAQALIAGLPRLDIPAALPRFLGDAKSLAKMLRGFKTNQAEAMAKIDAALMAQQYEDAERHAHTLKGLAATFGMTGLAQAADQVEQGLRPPMAEGADLHTLQAAVAELGRQMMAVLADLRAHFDSAGASKPELFDGSPPDAADPAALATLRSQLLQLLQASDLDAQTLAEEQAPLLRAWLGQAKAATLLMHLEKIDFDAALLMLEASSSP